MFTQEFKAAAFSSATGKWDTPQNVTDDLATVFDWDCDVCAERPNVCDFYYDEEQDGLNHNWLGLCWMNPPYGREIKKWMEKARLSGFGMKFKPPLCYETKTVTAVVCLVPARTDTQWWHDNVKFASQVVFVKGRLKFGDATNSAPFPSAFVVFGDISDRQRDKLAEYGWSISTRPPN